MKTGLIEQIHLFNDRPSEYFKEVNAEGLFKEVRKYFYNPITYKWSLKRCAEFISENRIDPDNFILFLNTLFNLQFKASIDQNGSKQAFNFIVTIQNSKTFQASGYSTKGISLKENVYLIDFLKDMKEVTEKHLNIPHEEMIKFLFENFKTGKTVKTLRRYYYDKN